MRFIGREEQLSKLNRAIAKTHKDGAMQTILIYGRRRVGKSELVKQLLKNTTVPGIYYECRQVAEESNAQGICNILSEELQLPKLGYQSIDEVLEYIFQRACEENMIFVLDEYPYLRENIRGMDSILQTMIDKYRDSAKLTFIILGSYVEIMRNLLEHANPLYGRIDLTINLKPMDYYKSAEFYQGLSEEDRVRIYSVFGGIPYYNRLVDDSVSAEENLMELLVTPEARLENEVPLYLNAEISKITNANEVFEALSRGYSKYKDILDQSHVSSGPTLVDVLDKLSKMEVVERRTPINDERNKRKASYHISDPLSAFYYRYIFRYASQRKIMDPKAFYDKYIREDFESIYVPHYFEEICRQYLIRKNQAGQISPVIERIGKYYYDLPAERRNGEFDIVTQDQKGYVFYEVKFREEKISAAAVREEITQVKATGMNCYKYVFISKSPVDLTGIEEPIGTITLQDIWN
ncbi:MAG: ATP-binding protein [Lachnospiraceae bacterium]|nr:ATP-binding protein [Lachnospiraceae bacterium]